MLLLVRLLSPLPLYHVFLNWKPLFLLVCMCLILIVKRSRLTCIVGSAQLLISHLCLHCELNDLRNCRLKWKGSGEGGNNRKKRDSGVHLELKNLNFPAHLKLERH